MYEKAEVRFLRFEKLGKREAAEREWKLMMRIGRKAGDMIERG
jgi:hypothetical protein